jgi:hypothetical protein
VMRDVVVQHHRSFCPRRKSKEVMSLNESNELHGHGTRRTGDVHTTEAASLDSADSTMGREEFHLAADLVPAALGRLFLAHSQAFDRHLHELQALHTEQPIIEQVRPVEEGHRKQCQTEHEENDGKGGAK